MSLSCLVLASAPVAFGFDFSPVPQMPRPDEDRKPLEFFVGYAYGTDSNVNRAPSGSELDDTASELVVGAALLRRKPNLDIDLDVAMRMDTYSELDYYNFDETVANVRLAYSTNKLVFGLSGRYALLADPTEVETLTFDLLERTEVSYAPEIGLRLGGSELVASYKGRSLAFEDPAVESFDRDETALGVEMRFWTGERTRRFFVAYDAGTVDYKVDLLRRDFDRKRIGAGLWTSTARSSTFELVGGTYAVTVDDPAVSEEGGAFVRLRSTMLMNSGGSSLEFGFSRDAEAAATADFKEANRVLLRYVRRASRRWQWSVGYRAEISDFVDPEASFSVHNASAGLEGALGSRGRFHGRVYLTVGYELGRGDPPLDEFDRLRVLAGLALAR